MARVSRRAFLLGAGAAAATTAVGVGYPFGSGVSAGTTTGTRPPVAGGPRALGAPLGRIEGILKVTGRAPYAYEHQVADPAYLYPLQATIATGRITRIDSALATAEPGVLAILSHLDAPQLVADIDAELWILQSDQVFSRGQVIGGVVAESIEVARHAAGLVRVDYEAGPHDTVLTRDRSDLYSPPVLNAGFATDTSHGDVDTAMASATATVDATYSTPMSFHNPMEPHATIATWTGGELERAGNGRVPLHAIPGYEERASVRPGLTGLAQIYAPRDVARRQKFRYDRLYVRRRSLWLDLRLIALSFWISARGTWEHEGNKW